MCYLCLESFQFELPENPELEQKKERLVKIKWLLKLSAWMVAMEAPLCEERVEALKAEQYELSREF